MNSEQKSAKGLWISGIVFQVLSFCLILFTMILICFEEFGCWEYDELAGISNFDCSVIMAVVAVVSILIALLFWSFSFNKKRTFVIALIVFNIFAVICLLLVHIFIIEDEYYLLFTFPAYCLLLINIILAIPFLVVTSPNRVEKPAVNKNSESDWSYELRELKNLHDSHVISWQDYENGKKSIFAKYGMGGAQSNYTVNTTSYSDNYAYQTNNSFDGEYESRGAKMIIKNNTFYNVVNGVTTKSGRAVSQNNGTIVLYNDSTNQRITLIKDGNNLKSANGAVNFRKV